MKTHSCIWLLFLCMGCLYAASAKGQQNIINDTVLVNTESEVTFRFQSKCEGELKDGDGSYLATGGGTNKTLLVKATKKNVKDQPFTVKEGDRKHEFVLVYSDNVPTLMIDLSNSRKLKDHVAKKKMKRDANLAEAQQLFDREQYFNALAKYERLYYDVEPQQRETINANIAKCKEKLQEKNQALYKTSIAKGDVFALEKKYKEADAEFAAAETAYPGDTAALGKRSRNRQIWFNVKIKEAEEADRAGNSSLSKSCYDEAKNVDADAFRRRHSITYGRVVKAASDQVYKQQKTKGDAALQEKNLLIARQAFNSALLEKPNDVYCVNKLKKINELQVEADKIKEREKEYYAYLSKAKMLTKKAVTVNDYNMAIDEYNKASKLFKDRKFAQNKAQALTRMNRN